MVSVGKYPIARQARASGASARGAGAQLARTVEVDEDAEAELLAVAQHALQLVDGAVGAAVVRPVRRPHPVADGHAQRVDAAARQLGEVLLGHPLLPVDAQLAVGLLRAEHAAEAVHVHRRLVGGPALELVEERRRHPRLEHEPAAEVDAARLRLEQIAPVVPLLAAAVLVALQLGALEQRAPGSG